MPKMDGTGPDGKGAKTGMQRGKCEGAESQCPKGGRGRGFRAQGRGMGKGFGQGRKE